ncbi:hypothetical protein Ddye_010278 [Dipteronia dyeriana]|uniref:non-specific serine/threonine protein kinase n=1 Tax=Dipteronia dyeriana TaxID=168575 RepID=A0AAD9XCZ5_9ROSI|nr:hypothetical protein Ddye_010278 [Dipteronia dyeriana]
MESHKIHAKIKATAPAPDSSSSPPSNSSSNAPPPSSPSPPPPPQEDESPPPSNNDNSPPPPPPDNNNQSPPPPPPSDNNDNSPPPPPSDSKSPPPPSSSKRPPPPPSTFVSPPPPSKNTSRSSSLSPPPPPKTSTSTSSSDSSSLNTAIIVGVTLAGLLVIALIAMCALCVCMKKKKKKESMYYGGEAPQPYNKGSEQYYNNSQQPNGPSWLNQNWQSHGHGQDHGGSKLPPPPGGGGWQPPPPPPPMMSSGEQSSQFSGPMRPPLPPPSPNIALGFNKSTFTYDELASATGGFAQSNVLGQGGFGYVHKGVLPNGKDIAVKSLKSGSGQGEREFQAEVEIISRVHHRHLVSLVGYCIAGGQRMLVYEFVANKTLEHHLHGKGLPVMDWNTRLRIALGSAKGLAYLHEDCHPRIIHRDIKAANILLDNNFEAMVADFGLAKLSTDNHTHVSTRVMGTFGYLAPEYASSGKLTEKSDVFSFGVMLLELITGKRPVDLTNAMEDSLVDWARPLMAQALQDGNYNELADANLEQNYNPLEMARMVSCAAASIRHSARKRPKMSQIVRALEGDSSLEDLNEGVKPGQSSIYNSTTSSDYSQSSYNADMKKFRQMALGSQEFPSSESAGSSTSDSHELRQL